MSYRRGMGATTSSSTGYTEVAAAIRADTLARQQATAAMLRPERIVLSAAVGVVVWLAVDAIRGRRRP